GTRRRNTNTFCSYSNRLTRRGRRRRRLLCTSRRSTASGHDVGAPWENRTMKPRANARQQRRADIPAFWCSWGRHDTIQMSHVKEHFPAGTMCLACQMKIVENITEVISFPQMSLAMHRQEQRLLDARRRNNKFEKRM